MNKSRGSVVGLKIKNIRQFLETYKKTVDKYNIKLLDTYNMDETGLRIGVGRG